MSKLSSKTNAFFYKNRNKGIPNLMLFIAIGNAVVWVLSMLNQENMLFYTLLRFDYEQILRLQLWRLFTYPLTYLVSFGRGFGVLLGVISLFFFYWCGRTIEASWGTLRFNLYYLTGVLLTDVAAMLIGLIGDLNYPTDTTYVNLSLILAMATMQPEAGVRLYFVIPIKMKWLAWLELGFTVYETVMLIISYGFLRFAWLLPLSAVGNYFLFFGKNFVNVLPDFLRHPKNRAQHKAAMNFKQTQYYTNPERGTVHTVLPYRFKCTVCGRTDVSNPGLEFRYCSKCAGYRCYCMEHINNHAHITE